MLSVTCHRVSLAATRASDIWHISGCAVKQYLEHYDRRIIVGNVLPGKTDTDVEIVSVSGVQLRLALEEGFLDLKDGIPVINAYVSDKAQYGHHTLSISRAGLGC